MISVFELDLYMLSIFVYANKHGPKLSHSRVIRVSNTEIRLKHYPLANVACTYNTLIDHNQCPTRPQPRPPTDVCYALGSDTCNNKIF